MFLIFAFLILVKPISVFAADSSSSTSSGADSSSSSGTWDDLNPPQWAKDIRRTEIITLGSLPFVTLWTTVGYSLAVLGEFHNPFDKSSDGFDESDQLNIVKISAATCLGLGAFDLGYHLIKRAIVKKRGRKQEKQAIEVLPFSVEQREQDDINPPPPPPKPEYFECGVESAIF